MDKANSIDDWRVEKLRNITIGEFARIGRVELAPSIFVPQAWGLCYGCYFQHKGGGIPACKYWHSCTANNRPDGQSVIFVKHKESVTESKNGIDKEKY